MFGTKRVKAVLESKSVIEKKNAPLGQAIIFANVEQSGSFMRTDTFYMLTFRIGEKKKELRVTKEIYEKLYEGVNGILRYQGSIFEDFMMEEDV